MALARCFGLRLPLIASFLAALAAGSGAGPLAAGKAPGAGLPKEHRVIVRFSAEGGDDADAQLDTQVEKMVAHSGVVSAAALRQVGMIIVACESREAQEELVEHLDKDPEVELAVPDTMVTLLGGELRPPAAAKGRGLRGLAEGRLDQQVPAQCSAHPACVARGLVGDCCPTSSGTQFSCCAANHIMQVAFRSHSGTYLSADASGLVSASATAINKSSTFFIEPVGEGNVPLTVNLTWSTLDGEFLSAWADGRVTANGTVALETFNLTFLENGTVTLKSTGNMYVSANRSGDVRATAVFVSPWEQFVMVDVPLPNHTFPNDELFPILWGLEDYAGNDIDAAEAWTVWTGDDSEGITVAVIDSGIDYQHEDLQGQMWVNVNEIPGNGIDDDGNGFVDDIYGVDFVTEDSDPMDDDGHGTHCAGTIGGRGNNSLGVTGVIWRGVRLMALKTLPAHGAGTISDAIRAIDYAIANGARILSNSWGGPASNPQLRGAIERAERAGILFVVAAGNDGTDSDENPQYPGSYETANIVVVASASVNGSLASFSSFGAESVDVAAPGEYIWSTAPGHPMYAKMSGTSTAAPYVSGLAALVWTFRPALSMHQVRDILLESVRKEASLEGKVATGGMINAKSAIEAARTLQPPVPPKHAPAGIQFVDTDGKVGRLGGVVTVTAAVSEADIEYYRVYFVSAAGYMVDALGPRIPATGAKEYTLQINGSIKVPQYAARLAAVAGCTSGEQPVVPGPDAPPSVALKDFIAPEFLPKAVVWGGDTDRRPGVANGSLFIGRVAGVLDETGRLADAAVRLQLAPGEKPILAWAADLEEELTASATAFGHVRCSVTVPGLDAQAVATIEARGAFERAVASALPGVSAANVRVMRVLAVTRSQAGLVEPGGRRLAEAVEEALDRHPVAATVEFEVEAPEGAAGATAMLDRVEARLILLSTGGGAAARFDAALASELRGAGVLPATVQFDRSRVHEPQHLGPRFVAARHQRAARRRRQLQGVQADQETVEEAPVWAFVSAMAASTAGIAMVAFAALWGRGGRGGLLLEREVEAL